MEPSRPPSRAEEPIDLRRISSETHEISGVSVREDDIEPTHGIRAVAWLFRGMAGLLILLMLAQLVIGFTGAVPLSPGVLLAEAVRLVIFAGLLWGAGDLAVLAVKSHYDLRATRILMARIAYMMRESVEGRAPLDGNAGVDTSVGDR